jgi:tripeptide aminopeptidase
MSSIVERFMRYISIDTQSDEDSGTSPSTAKQFRLARLLAEEMTAMGISDVRLDDHHCYVYGYIPSNLSDKDVPAVGFISHMDTAPRTPGDAGNARIHKNYDGGIIHLNDTVSLDPEIYPELRNYVGCDLIVTDGVSLLGSDDKAGIAEIMTMAERLLADPSIPHGKIGIAFTSDEEIGHGADYFDVEGFGMDYAYTVDGGEIGELEYENFNAAEARVYINGRDIHPGSAKGIMINAVRIAAELDGMLPQEQRPEYTDGYDGFYHMTQLHGSEGYAEARYIIRDHDAELFDQKIELMETCVDYLNVKYDNAVQLVIREQYRNMKELIEPHMFLIDDAKAAFRACGVEPKVIAIRGGTDGARLTYEGLPCPNLSTGGMNFHSNTEYIPVQSLEKMADVLTELVTAK